ncbi:MAG: hypothetical protein ACE5OZ_23175 [Candidatus Heimdallarchaeota archaeon]
MASNGDSEIRCAKAELDYCPINRDCTKEIFGCCVACGRPVCCDHWNQDESVQGIYCNKHSAKTMMQETVSAVLFALIDMGVLQKEKFKKFQSEFDSLYDRMIQFQHGPARE